jgi:hypothetical protein
MIRKTLGKHEIATVQSTTIDQAAGFVNLKTVVALRKANGSQIGQFAH